MSALISGFSLGSGSQKRLRGVNTGLARVVLRAIEITQVDFSVIYGLRTAEEQAYFVATGASNNPNSAHLRGEAVDLVPYLGIGHDPYPRSSDHPSIRKLKLRNFELVAMAMFQAADELEFALQWGNDWDQDGTPTSKDPDEKGWLADMPHFQVPPAHRLEQAKRRREERILLRAQGIEVIS